MIANTLQLDVGSDGEFHRVVALSSLFARKLGTTAAAWLCQAVYTQTKAGVGRLWSKKLLADHDENGQMIRPEREIDQSFEYETGLTRSEQASARRAAKELGVLTERRSTYQGRIEYLIDLDGLRRHAEKWANDERNIARSGKQEITFMTEESDALESEILHSSTKSIEVKKSRTPTSDPFAGNDNPIPGRHAAGGSSIKASRKTMVEIEGVECWFDSDKHLVNSMLEKHGEEKVRSAVSELQNAGKRLLPSAVEKILSRTLGPDMVEQTSQLLSKYDDYKNEKDRRRAASKAAQQLSPSDRRKFVLKFIEQNGSGSTSSFDFATDDFLNPAERIEFKRWLETQFMQDNAAPT
jgi:hypothetical protein